MYKAESVIYNVQRGIIPKLYDPELWFLGSAHCLMMLYICINNLKGDPLEIQHPKFEYRRLGFIESVHER